LERATTPPHKSPRAPNFLKNHFPKSLLGGGIIVISLKKCKKNNLSPTATDG
jgi:hypothetical protein